MNGSVSETHILEIPNLLGPRRQTYDLILSSILITCTVVGLPGNILTLTYFLTRPQKDIASRLYVRICSVDTVTSLAHLPVTISLMAGRDPVLFRHMWVCVSWTIIFMFLQKISMFLVLLLSVSRTIALTHPFYKLNKRAVFASLIMYVTLEVLHESLQFLWNNYKYIPIGPFCTAKHGGGVWAEVISPTLTAAQIGLPPLLTFLSFVLCLVKLRTGSYTELQTIEIRRSQERATVTIAYFTALFLLCNLSYFAMRVIVIIHNISGWELPGPIFSPPFLHEYHLPFSKILCTVLNASLNPPLYLWRMSNLRKWVCGIKDDVIASVASKPVTS